MKSDNELIAEFMGLERAKANRDYFFIQEYSAYVAPDNILYHKSWDWLMPVVEKIAEISAEKKGQTIDKAFELIDSLPITSKLEWVYKGVVEFIKWFNQQKQ
jgi:hypothetical protein